MKKLMTLLACLCTTLAQAQQPVTVLNNGAGGGTLNTPGVTTYFGGANTFNFVGSTVIGIPTNVGSQFATLSVTGISQLNGAVGIAGTSPSAIVDLADTSTTTNNAERIGAEFTPTSSQTSGAFSSVVAGGLFIALVGAANTQNWTGSPGLDGGILEAVTQTGATGTITEARAGDVAFANGGSTTITKGSLLYVRAAINSGTITSLAGINAASQTVATNNTDILYGTTTIPTGTNYGIYQGDSYANYFNGATSFGGTVTSTNYALTGTGSFAVASIIGSALNGFQINEKTGATYDFVLENPAGNTMVLAVPTGTNTLEAVGNFFIGNNTLVLNGGGGGGGTAGSAVLFQKTVTAIADNTATTVLTITVPNAAHSAMIHVILNGSLGAGGAIGANEASATVTYDIVVTRTAGVNAVANAATAYGAANAIVAGGTSSITCTAALTAVSGAVGATNTFNFQVTIHRGNGAATNHTCQVSATTVNMNASGVTTT